MMDEFELSIDWSLGSAGQPIDPTVSIELNEMVRRVAAEHEHIPLTPDQARALGTDLLEAADKAEETIENL